MKKKAKRLNFIANRHFDVSDARWTLIQNKTDPIQQTLISIPISIFFACFFHTFIMHFKRLEWFIKESIIFATINMNGIWVERSMAHEWSQLRLNYTNNILNYCNMCIYSYTYCWNVPSEINQNDINGIEWKQINNAATIFKACSTFCKWSNGP